MGATVVSYSTNRRPLPSITFELKYSTSLPKQGLAKPLGRCMPNPGTGELLLLIGQHEHAVDNVGLDDNGDAGERGDDGKVDVMLDSGDDMDRLRV
jgi:hypothetical protein